MKEKIILRHKIQFQEKGKRNLETLFQKQFVFVHLGKNTHSRLKIIFHFLINSFEINYTVLQFEIHEQ